MRRCALRDALGFLTTSVRQVSGPHPLTPSPLAKRDTKLSGQRPHIPHLRESLGDVIKELFALAGFQRLKPLY